MLHAPSNINEGDDVHEETRSDHNEKQNEGDQHDETSGVATYQIASNPKSHTYSAYTPAPR